MGDTSSIIHRQICSFTLLLLNQAQREPEERGDIAKELFLNSLLAMASHPGSSPRLGLLVSRRIEQFVLSAINVACGLF